LVIFCEIGQQPGLDCSCALNNEHNPSAKMSLKRPLAWT